MKTIKEMLNERSQFVQDKRVAKDASIKAEAQLRDTSWLNYVIRKSHDVENGYFINLWDQSPQYRIVFFDKNRVRDLPVFLTDKEVISLNDEFERSIRFCSNTRPSNKELESYTSFITNLFDNAIKWDDLPYCKPYKFYTYHGIQFDIENATEEEIEQVEEWSKPMPKAKKSKIIIKKNKVKTFFNWLYQIKE